MAAKVYANGMEVSGKASSHKVLASMPDVCLSPPSPPAGPIPIPYPNFAQASDTTGGSKKVKAGGKEINLKGKSKYKKSKGDEAATRSFGAGLISHSITGAVKHKAGSFDVKAEGSSVVRNLDLTTGNHSNPGDGCVTVDAAKVKIAAGEPLNCEELDVLNKDTRDNELRPSAAKIDDNGVAQRGYTLTTSSFTKGGSSTFSKAGSRGSGIKSGSREGFAKARKKGECMGCGGGEEWGNGGSNNHTEPKLIGKIFDKTPGPAAPGSLGTLTMNIHWQPKGELPSKKPCARCKKGICKAVACGLQIKLCNDKGEAENAPCKKGKWVGSD